MELNVKVGLAMMIVGWSIAAICVLFVQRDMISFIVTLASFFCGVAGLYIAMGVQSDGNLFGVR